MPVSGGHVKYEQKRYPMSKRTDLEALRQCAIRRELEKDEGRDPWSASDWQIAQWREGDTATERGTQIHNELEQW